MTAADVVLLLVSADFLNSDYAYGREMRQALDQHEAGRTRVVPVIMRHCDWNSEGSLLGALQAIPVDALPIDRHPHGEDYAFTEVIRGLRQLAKTLRVQRVSGALVDRPAATPALPPTSTAPALSVRPAWAQDAGRDQFGDYADLAVSTDYGSAVQRLRWIEPGTFGMGSPDKEFGREPNEGPRHQVTIGRGFWLADTACTQALWIAVMGTNPSDFQGNLGLPVEQVSWHDVQAFLHQLQSVVSGVGVALPTEAQCEYACRAGSDRPFSIGKNITPQQVNYDGNHPYANGAKGEYRQKTMPMKSLPPNVRGLFEMHGNVWEWCADGLRQYSDQPAVDPEGRMLDKSVPRAVRGGSWYGNAVRARSASRYHFEPGDRAPFLGFRLCLRSSPVE